MSTIAGATQHRRKRHWVLRLIAIVLFSGSACSNAKQHATNPAVAHALAVVSGAMSLTSGYRGPLLGPPAQPSGEVAFVAADLTNGGIAGAARGAQEAARAIGWTLKIVDGQGTAERRRAVLQTVLKSKPAGIILGGFDASEQGPALRQAQAMHIPVVGWHAAIRPGPDPAAGLFTNVTTDPTQVALLAANIVIADSNGTAGVVIFTDSEYSIATYKTSVMAATLKKCPGCSLLRIIDTPISDAQISVSAIVSSLLQTYGNRLTAILAVNGVYVTGARPAFVGAGLAPSRAPFSVTAGDGDAGDFQRVRSNNYERATVAEPLNLQGWQLIDELNRARAGQPPSGYLAPPHVITTANVPDGAVFDPPSDYRNSFRRIWDG